MSSDFFNIFTDPQIRNKVGYYKNVDDILTTAKDIGELEARMKTLLKICRARNMKLAPSKFQMVQRVVYRGTMLEASKQMCDRDLSAYISPIQ